MSAPTIELIFPKRGEVYTTLLTDNIYYQFVNDNGDYLFTTAAGDIKYKGRVRHPEEGFGCREYTWNLDEFLRFRSKLSNEQIAMLALGGFFAIPVSEKG